MASVISGQGEKRVEYGRLAAALLTHDKHGSHSLLQQHRDEFERYHGDRGDDEELQRGQNLPPKLPSRQGWVPPGGFRLCGGVLPQLLAVSGGVVDKDVIEEATSADPVRGDVIREVADAPDVINTVIIIII